MPVECLDCGGVAFGILTIGSPLPGTMIPKYAKKCAKCGKVAKRL